MNALTPKEAFDQKGTHVPDCVIEAVNELLLEKLTCYDDKTLMATIQQKDIVELVLKQNVSLTKAELFKHHWLDFESTFIRAGWDVKYDRPAYNETYEPKFEFRAKL